MRGLRLDASGKTFGRAGRLTAMVALLYFTSREVNVDDLLNIRRLDYVPLKNDDDGFADNPSVHFFVAVFAQAKKELIRTSGM
jgi:hypothetical protein